MSCCFGWMSLTQSRSSLDMRSGDGAVAAVIGATPAEFDINRFPKDGFTRAVSSDDGTHCASTLRSRRRLGSSMALAHAPLVLPRSRGQPQCGDPAIKLAEGAGAAVPDHLRCQNVTDAFANFEKIGMGSSSVAYRALRISDGKGVVLKARRRRNADEVILAKREFALLKDLKHPNIVVALDFLESPWCVALVLEDIVGRNLRLVVRSAASRRLNELGSMRLFVQAVAGLAYLHDQSIVHRVGEYEARESDHFEGGPREDCRLQCCFKQRGRRAPDTSGDQRIPSPGTCE
ncbi:unnamed protein product [Prorocentrum cordatum]|uniref:Protein kinase domain-containing protein n=1 Tax=Prorocentrum cordatum TaxID=2364126 RepID=A0ABN9TEM1_9DINO|nr:unnamed protein product [Polarella glacialis]